MFCVLMKNQWKILLTCLLVPVLINKITALNPDGEALLSFKTAIVNSDGVLSHWRQEDPDPCGWKGVTCDNQTRSVIYLSLSFHKLSGSISPDIGKLKRLKHLSLHDNNFYGAIPSELGNCTELRAFKIIPINIHGISHTYSQVHESNKLSCFLKSAAVFELQNSNGPVTNTIQANSPVIASKDKVQDTTDEIQQNVSANIDPSSNKPSTSTSHLVFPPKTQMEELSFSTRPLLQSKEPSSLSEIRYLHLQDYFTAEALFPEAEKSSAHLDCSESSLADSSGVQGSSSRVLLGNRIRVYPHGANIQLPEGITRLPISDNEWVAVEVEGCRSPLYH